MTVTASRDFSSQSAPNTTGDDAPPVWFITGCSSGFGRALAEAALARGDRVAVTARDPGRVADLAARYPDGALALALDVTVADSVVAAVAAALQHFGRVDVLVNNAGYGLVGAVEEVSDAEARAEFDTNVFGALAVTRAVLPGMRARKAGRILNISSVAGQAASPGLGMYSSTKFAVEGWSEALAQEVAPLGIRVTLIEPGGFRTNWAGGSMQEAKQTMADYAATSGRTRGFLAQAGGRTGDQPQGGDPALAARAMLAVADAPDPPLRLPLGADALAGIRRKLAAVAADLDRWETLSRSTAGSPGAARAA